MAVVCSIQPGQPDIVTFGSVRMTMRTRWTLILAPRLTSLRSSEACKY